MFPGFSMRDSTDVSTNTPIKACQFYCGKFSSWPKSANLSDILFSKFCMTESLSSGVSALLNRIGPIFGIGSKPEMFRIYARWVIAFMESIKAFWYLSIMDYPRSPISIKSLSISAGQSIPADGFSSCPQPAGRSFFDIFPETKLKWLSFIYASAWFTSWSTRYFSNSTIDAFKKKAASLPIWINFNWKIGLERSAHIVYSTIIQKRNVYGY
jgi:hypothetical protein